MIQAVIFDMDGILIDSEIEYLKQDFAFAKKKNPAVTLPDLFGMVGSSRKDAWECMARAVNNGQTWQELRDEFRASKDVFSEMDYQKIFRPEVVPVLEYIKKLNLKLALASSTQMEIIERVLKENHIRSYFPVVVSGAQFQRSKPDPEIYHYTAAQLGVPESGCLVIEDSTFGITAASRAGMKIAALIDRRFSFDQSLAGFRMESLTEIPSIIQSLL
jgi:haloacid dehalogenase superfamily, subfamily IA, variant 3 with third motif having DD or ED/haloacid dehalogenase superfamily, subfamily IA, variant 1 with third motif having Dx(3-4)D or Dx(3-4)E